MDLFGGALSSIATGAWGTAISPRMASVSIPSMGNIGIPDMPDVPMPDMGAVNIPQMASGNFAGVGSFLPFPTPTMPSSPWGGCHPCGGDLTSYGLYLGRLIGGLTGTCSEVRQSATGGGITPQATAAAFSSISTPSPTPGTPPTHTGPDPFHGCGHPNMFFVSFFFGGCSSFYGGFENALSRCCPA